MFNFYYPCLEKKKNPEVIILLPNHTQPHHHQDVLPAVMSSQMQQAASPPACCHSHSSSSYGVAKEIGNGGHSLQLGTSTPMCRTDKVLISFSFWPISSLIIDENTKCWRSCCTTTIRHRPLLCWMKQRKKLANTHWIDLPAILTHVLSALPRLRAPVLRGLPGCLHANESPVPTQAPSAGNSSLSTSPPCHAASSTFYLHRTAAFPLFEAKCQSAKHKSKCSTAYTTDDASALWRSGSKPN